MEALFMVTPKVVHFQRETQVPEREVGRRPIPGPKPRGHGQRGGESGGI